MRVRYLRIVLRVEGVRYVLALEWRDDEIGIFRTVLKVRMKTAVNGIPPGRYGAVVAALERMVDGHYADRKFFVEVGNEHESWIETHDMRRD